MKTVHLNTMLKHLAAVAKDLVQVLNLDHVLHSNHPPCYLTFVHLYRLSNLHKRQRGHRKGITL